MLWSVPRWHKGQVPRSRANTRLRSRAQLQCGAARLRLVHPLLARWRNDGVPQRAMRRQTPRLADERAARQGDERGPLLSQFQRRQCHAGRAVRPRVGARVHAVPMGLFRKALQRHGAACRVPQQAFHLVAAMRWSLRVGVQRKPMDTGTARTRQCGACPFLPTARAHPSPRLPGPRATGHTRRDGGGQSARERGCCAAQRIIPGGHGVGATRLQVSQVA